MSIYFIQIFKVLLPNPLDFILSQCQPPISILYFSETLYLPSFCITHFLPKIFPISIHILIHIPSKLFINFLFVLIYASFNLTLFYFVSFHTSFFCLFIASYQHLLPSIFLSYKHNFYLMVLAHTFCTLSHHSHWATHFSCPFNCCPFHLLQHVLDIIFSFPFYSLLLKRPSIFLSLPSYPAADPSSPAQIYYALYLHSVLTPCYPCVLVLTPVLKVWKLIFYPKNSRANTSKVYHCTVPYILQLDHHPSLALSISWTLVMIPHHDTSIPFQFSLSQGKQLELSLSKNIHNLLPFQPHFIPLTSHVPKQSTQFCWVIQGGTWRHLPPHTRLDDALIGRRNRVQLLTQHPRTYGWLLQTAWIIWGTYSVPGTQVIG